MGNAHHIDRSYKIRVMKIGCIIIRSSRHIKITPVTPEQYLRDQIIKNRSMGPELIWELKLARYNYAYIIYDVDMNKIRKHSCSVVDINKEKNIKYDYKTET